MILLYKFYIFLVLIIFWMSYEYIEKCKKNDLNDEVNKDLNRILNSDEYNNNNNNNNNKK
ncbi:hypothetical protein CPAV1605_956 [seawater metagenome]|uniref:Uncharacterized protein n=1 Tax=seawater metagenome TaxID=1561972 RepID=A0A5E8CJ15_9ZZZZ